MSHSSHGPVDSQALVASHQPLLNQLQILNPCHADWEAMTGSERERHCASCSKSVHNLIEHTADEAVRLVTQPDVHLCVRLHRDADGNVLTKDSPPPAGPTRRGMLGRLAWLAASWLGLSTTFGCNKVMNILNSSATSGNLCLPPTQNGNPSGTGRSMVQGNLMPSGTSRGPKYVPPSPTAPPSATASSTPTKPPAATPSTTPKTSPDR